MTVKETVIDILSIQETARNSDLSLMYHYVLRKGMLPSQTTIYDLLQLMRSGKFPTMETLTRARRQAQQHHPELRGTNYDKRHANQTKVKRDLGYTV